MIYDYTDYRSYLRDAIEARKATRGLTYSKVAEACSVQRSYLSLVLSGKGNLSSDQIYAVSRLLGLSFEESDYLQLLLEIERTALFDRRESLIQSRERIRSQQLKSAKALNREMKVVQDEDWALYYSDPTYPLVHMHLTIPYYLEDLSRIEQALTISNEKLQSAIQLLERCQLLTYEKKKVKLLKSTLHLSDESPFSRINAISFRVKALEHCRNFERPKDSFFTASFTADEATRMKIKRRFLEFLSEVNDLVEKAPSKEVYHLNVDLFRIAGPSV